MLSIEFYKFCEILKYLALFLFYALRKKNSGGGVESYVLTNLEQVKRGVILTFLARRAGLIGF